MPKTITKDQHTNPVCVLKRFADKQVNIFYDRTKKQNSTGICLGTAGGGKNYHSLEEWFRDNPDDYKRAVIKEIKKQGGSEEDIALVSDELVKNNLMDGKYRSPGDVAWAILQ